MEQITLRLPEEQIDALDDEADEAGVSRSEYIRDVLASRDEGAEEVERLRERVEKLETEADRLREEKRLILEEREEKRELARYAEDQRSMERRRREAGLATRAKWWVFGMDEDDE